MAKGRGFAPPRTCSICGTRFSATGKPPIDGMSFCKLHRIEGHRHRARRSARPYVPVPKIDCPFCGAMMTRNRKQCGARECARLYRNAKAHNYAAKKRAEGVDIYAPYRASAYAKLRERIESGELAPARQRYPDRFRTAEQRRRARKAGAATEEFTNKEIFERDGWICGICNLPVDPTEVWPEPGFATLGHVVPFARGGDHTRANVRLEHLYCNMVKGKKLDEELA